MSAKKKAALSGGASIGGLLGGLTDLIEKLGELSDAGSELRETGELGNGKLKAVYGLRVKFASDGEAVGVEPFGNVKIDKKLRRPVVQGVREPLVDVIEEPDHVLVVAEMPGVNTGDVSVEVTEDIMSIEAAHSDKHYRKEIMLPRRVSNSDILISCNNGIVEIRCQLK